MPFTEDLLFWLCNAGTGPKQPYAHTSRNSPLYGYLVSSLCYLCSLIKYVSVEHTKLRQLSAFPFVSSLFSACAGTTCMRIQLNGAGITHHTCRLVCAEHDVWVSLRNIDEGSTKDSQVLARKTGSHTHSEIRVRSCTPSASADSSEHRYYAHLVPLLPIHMWFVHCSCYAGNQSGNVAWTRTNFQLQVFPTVCGPERGEKMSHRFNRTSITKNPSVTSYFIFFFAHSHVDPLFLFVENCVSCIYEFFEERFECGVRRTRCERCSPFRNKQIDASHSSMGRVLEMIALRHPTATEQRPTETIVVEHANRL